MKTLGVILLLVALLGLCKAVPVDREGSPEEKPGVCPVPDSPCWIVMPKPRMCFIDKDCGGIKKCCQLPCSYECKDPVSTDMEHPPNPPVIEPGPADLHETPQDLAV
ncbi:veswaprin-c-like [Lissotriton helveticus]